jgi:hypothetical protein
VRIKHDAILPNRFRADVRECFLVAAGYGDLASERAYLRTEAITCIREDGGAIEVPLDAYAVGEDGKVGVRGRLVSKQGQVIGKAMLARFAEGFSQMFGRVPVPVVATTAGTTQPFQQAFSGQAVQAGAVKGVGSALDRLANYFMDMAEEMFPVIEVDAGRGIEFVLNRGATLRLGQGRTQNGRNKPASGSNCLTAPAMIHGGRPGTAGCGVGPARPWVDIPGTPAHGEAVGARSVCSVFRGINPRPSALKMAPEPIAVKLAARGADPRAELDTQ